MKTSLAAVLGILFSFACSMPAFAQEGREDQEVDCRDPASYARTISNLKSCRAQKGGLFALFTTEDESAAGYVTCLDDNLRQTLIKEVADAHSEQDQSKVRAAEHALAPYRLYCKKIDQEISAVAGDMAAELTKQIEAVTDVLWMRLWQPEFIEYLLDPKGFYRGYFDGELWSIARAAIDESYDPQWFYDHEAVVTVSDMSGDISSDEPFVWVYTGSAELHLRLEDGRREDKAVRISLTIGADASHASDVNLAGFYVIDAELEDMSKVFEDFYDQFPTEPKKETD